MKRTFLLSGMLLAGSLGLAGCFSSTRIVQQTQAPDLYKSASVETVEQEIQDRDSKLQTLNANVLMVTATTGGGKTGIEKTYTSLNGYIFVRKPRDLRVLLQAPVFRSRALDMVSDANGFTMMHAVLHGPDVWMQGTNVVEAFGEWPGRTCGRRCFSIRCWCPEWERMRRGVTMT